MKTALDLSSKGGSDRQEAGEEIRHGELNAFDLFRSAKLEDKNRSSASDLNAGTMPKLEIASSEKDASKGTADDRSKDGSAAKRGAGAPKTETGSRSKEIEPKEKKQEDKVVKELRQFGEGLASGLVLKPINGLTQLLNHMFKTRIKKIEFKDQRELEKSAAGKIGQFAGDALSTAALGFGTAGLGTAMKVAGAGAKVVDLAAAGAIKGGILTPTDDDKFWEKRFVSATTGAVDKAKSSGRIDTAADTVRKVYEVNEKQDEKKKNESKNFA